MTFQERTPRILPDLSSGAANQNKPTLTFLAPPEETEHEKVFRLVGEQKFEEAARITARLVNAGSVTDFLIYGHTANYRRAKLWFDDMVKATKRAAAPIIHTMTPELAQIVIANNDGNRKLNAGNLASIMRDIAADRWQLNGASLSICRDGRTNDGQHRAFAVLLTGSSIKTGMTFGLSRDSMRTEDIGRKRTGADRLGIASVSNAIHVSAISALAFEIYNGRAATAAEAQDYFFENEEMVVLAHSVMGKHQKGLGVAPPGAAAFHLLKIGANEDDLRDFFTTLRTGEMIKRRNPIYTLREALKQKTVKWTRQQWVRGIVHHFIAWKTGRTLSNAVSPAELPEGYVKWSAGGYSLTKSTSGSATAIRTRPRLGRLPKAYPSLG